MTLESGTADTARALPPLGSLQAALRRTTETLAHELGRPGQQAPDWSEAEWRIARAVAALHGVSAVLDARLRWNGPSGWSAFLAEQRAEVRARALRVEVLLSLLDTTAREYGCAFVALKGVALHTLGLYQPGERPMADVDLLVREADAEPILQVLARLGYRQTDASWKERVFELEGAPPSGAFGERALNAIKIDVHARISERLPQRDVDISDLIQPLQPRPGGNPYPSRAALMSHLLLHAAGEMVFRTLRLIQLHDIALLCERLSSADWQEVLHGHEAPAALWWALPPLMLVERYYGAVPPSVLATLREACAEPLRRKSQLQVLSDLSYSDLRRSAFPGIDWASTLPERLTYVAARTWLSARTLLRPARAAETGAAHGAAPPPVGWHALRPARPATLNAVRAALAQPR